MKKLSIDVIVEMIVTVDETKFTPEFYEEFRSCIGDIGDDDVLTHMGYLAEKFPEGLPYSDYFIEGYGPANEMGITIEPRFVYCDNLEEI